MSSSIASLQAPARIMPGQVFIIGRVFDVEIFNGSRYTLVIAPSSDPYLHPDLYRIRSNKVLGVKGDDIKQLCKVVGYRTSPFEVTDKDTGQVRKVRSVNHFLEAIEE